MIGIILYIYFLFIGFMYADKIFRHKDVYFRSYMGGIFGNLILMAGIVPVAFVLGFSKVAHIVLIIVSIIPYIVLNFKKSPKIEITTEETITPKILLCLVLPISLVIWILMTNHILTPYDGGGVASGQSTYGDLQMHLGFVTSIAEQGKFPPEYAFLAGEKLNYPFFVELLSSSMYLFGTPLRWAVLIPSYVLALLLVTGFYMLAYRITNRKSAAVLATVFFFINGGFGFAYFLDGAKADHTAFTKIFTDYYHTPTNYNEMNIRWSNTICDMIIPQRTTMAGWCMIIPCIYMMLDAIKTKAKKEYIILGIMAGCMPMIHTHSFLALGILSAFMFFAYLKDAENKKAYVINWVIYGAIAVIMAFPQLILWTFTQTSGNDSFLNLHFNWVNKNDPYLWFYIKNWGLAFILAVPAFFNASKNNRRLFGAGLLIFVLAELIQFQPNEYDNNKLFYITYMIVLIIVSGFLVDVYEKIKTVKLRQYFAVIVIIMFTLSGVLTIGREFKSGGMYQTFNKDDIKTAEYIKKNVPSDAVILTGTGHLNPVVTLAGRTIYVGSSLYVHFHGFVNEYQQRSKEVNEVYAGTAEQITEFCKSKGISYVYLSNNEINGHKANVSEFERLNCVYSAGNNSLYKIQ